MRRALEFGWLTRTLLLGTRDLALYYIDKCINFQAGERKKMVLDTSSNTLMWPSFVKEDRDPSNSYFLLNPIFLSFSSNHCGPESRRDVKRAFLRACSLG